MPNTNEGSESWSEYRRMVLSDLRDLKGEQQLQRASIDKLSESVAGLRVKTAIWSSIGSAAVTLGINKWFHGH